MIYDVTFVFTSVVQKHIDAQNDVDLREHLSKEYGLGEEFYGPASEKLINMMKNAIEKGEFYITSYVRGFQPGSYDESAGSEPKEVTDNNVFSCKHGGKDEPKD